MTERLVLIRVHLPTPAPGGLVARTSCVNRSVVTKVLNAQ